MSRDVRKMEPMELVKFSLRVLRATPARKMRQRQWFTPNAKLDRMIWISDRDKYDLIFTHKKNCFACAVGSVLLADGKEAAREWDGVPGGSHWPIFTRMFFMGMSDEFEMDETPAAGRRAAIAYAEAKLTELKQQQKEAE